MHAHLQVNSIYQVKDFARISYTLCIMLCGQIIMYKKFIHYYLATLLQSFVEYGILIG